MAGLDPAIHPLRKTSYLTKNDRPADKPAHDEWAGDAPVGRRCSPSSRNVGHFCANGLQQRFDPALRDSARDEDDAAAAIVRRPTREPGGRVKDMLNAVDHCRPVRALRNVHDTLQAQEIGAAMLSQSFEK